MAGVRTLLHSHWSHNSGVCIRLQYSWGGLLCDVAELPPVLKSSLLTVYGSSEDDGTGFA
jgi:hypothetical protein